MAKKKSEAEKQITKELRRLRAAIRRAQRRGYIFDEDPLISLTEKAFKLQRPQTIAKHLREIKPKDIYKIAYHEAYLDNEFKFVKGEEYRAIERKEAAKKGLETRRTNKSRKQYRSVNQDWVDRVNNYTTEPIDEADTILSHVKDDTATQDADGLDTTSFLNDVFNDLAVTPYDRWRLDNYVEWKRITRHKAIDYINDAIDLFGVKEIARRLEEHATEIRELVDKLIYDSYAGEGDAGAKRDLTRLVQILHGGNITDAEVKDLS